jgi:type III secretory pathway component EscV
MSDVQGRRQRGETRQQKIMFKNTTRTNGSADGDGSYVKLHNIACCIIIFLNL